MATQVEIVNLALTRLAVAPITTIDDPVEAARLAKANWDLIRQSVLRDHAWGFANKVADLVVSAGDEVSGYSYVYAYPTDCLAARALICGSTGATVWRDSALTPTPQPFEKVFVTDHLVLACNVESARLQYTADVTAEALFDSLFVDAFAWRLAGELTKALTGGNADPNQMLQLYWVVIGQARAADSNEGRRSLASSNPYLEAR